MNSLLWISFYRLFIKQVHQGVKETTGKKNQKKQPKKEERKSSDAKNIYSSNSPTVTRQLKHPLSPGRRKQQHK